MQHEGLCSQDADGGSRCEQMTSELGEIPRLQPLGQEARPAVTLQHALPGSGQETQGCFFSLRRL